MSLMKFRNTMLSKAGKTMKSTNRMVPFTVQTVQRQQYMVGDVHFCERDLEGWGWDSYFWRGIIEIRIFIAVRLGKGTESA